MNLHNHNHRQLGEHVTDIHEREIFQAQLNAEKREMRIGSQNCKNIEALVSLSHIASLLAKKIEGNHTMIATPRKLSIEIEKLNQKIEDLEADFFMYQ